MHGQRASRFAAQDGLLKSAMGRPLGPPAYITVASPSNLARYILVSIAASPRHLFLHLHENLGQAV